MRENELKQIYIIGGGTCCGKTTISGLLCDEYGLEHYQQDDHLYEHIQLAAAAGHQASAAALRQTPQQMWVRDPGLMCRQELDIYAAILGCSFQEAYALRGRVLMEGAGFMPGMMAEMGIAKDRYICIAPTREFRQRQYSKREWLHQVLNGVQNKREAFANWMERDGLMADESLRQANQYGYETLIVDGLLSIEQTALRVAAFFKL